MSSSFSLSAKTLRNFWAVSSSSLLLLSLRSMIEYSDRSLPKPSVPASESDVEDILRSRVSSSDSSSPGMTVCSTTSVTLSRLGRPVRVLGPACEASFANGGATSPTKVLEPLDDLRCKDDCDGEEPKIFAVGFFRNPPHPLPFSPIPGGGAPDCRGG